MSQITAFPNDVFRFWREATFPQRIGILAFGVISVVLLVVTASIALRPHYATLYGGLAEKDAGAVVKQLQDEKIDYRLSSSGAVEVPADRVPEVRMRLAEKGLPSGGQDGWEIFDKTRIGLSDFGEKVSYQRALEGELARTICSLEAVEQARVQVSLPEQRLFTDTQVKPTASVMLTLRGGQQLQSGQVRSIVNVVSGAAGMAPEDVTVADSRGRLLSSPEGADGGASTQLEQRRAYERGLEQTLQTMLDNVVGPGASVVRASADLDFGRVETERETYQPGSDGKGILMTDQKATETYQGPVAGMSAVGKPGVSANTSAAPAAVVKTAGGGVQYQRSDGTTQYGVSREVEKRRQPPGQIKRLSISVLVDEKAKIGKIDDLKAVVSAAAGLDPKRGDQVVVTQAPFEPAAKETGGSKLFAIRDFYQSVGKDVVAVILMVVFLRFIAGLMRRKGGALPVVAPLPPVVAAPAPQTAASPAVAGAPGPAAPPPAPKSEIDFDPDRAAAVVRNWIASDAAAGNGGGGNGA